MMTSLRGKAVLFDLDGTVFFKGAQVPGADQALARLRKAGVPLRFLSNIDSRTPRTVAAELAQMGLDVAENEIFTPVVAALEFLSRNPAKRCYCLLSQDVAPLFTSCVGPDGEIDYVIVGDCRVSYEALNEAFRHIMAGAEIIALQKGRYYIRADGYYLDTGAFVQLLEYASGKHARVLGKPTADFFHLALTQMGYDANDAVVVGDDVATDVAGAKAVGAYAVLVRTGKFTPEALARSAVQPDLVVDSIADVPRLFGQ